jgi:hypothetical protein
LIFNGSSSNHFLVLGDGGRPGRMVYIKDIGGTDLWINGGGVSIYDSDSRTTTTAVNINNTMVYLIWDGSAWYLGYCG